MNLTGKDIVLEVGPGLGDFTLELVKTAKFVIAVEKDPNLVKILKKKTKGIGNVKIVLGDILKFNPRYHHLNHRKYKLVGNIPFYLTSALIRKFLENDPSPEEMVLVIQKELARRICSDPPGANLLSTSVRFYADSRVVFYISRKCFWPSPKVDSAVLQIRLSGKRKTIDSHSFFRVVRAGFSQPRKQLINNLCRALPLSKEKLANYLLGIGIQPSRRAETLSIKDWLKLARFVR